MWPGASDRIRTCGLSGRRTTTGQYRPTLKREFCRFCTVTSKTRKSPLLVTVTFYNLHILVRKNIYIDDGMIVDAVPEIYDKFFGGGEWYTGKAFICIFYNTKQNVATKSIGKSWVCLPDAMGQTALCLFASRRLFSLYLFNWDKSSITSISEYIV